MRHRRKSRIWLLTLVLLFCMQGCTAGMAAQEERQAEAAEQQEVKAPVIALLLSSEDSEEKESVTAVFTEAAEEAGAELLVRAPEVTEKAAEEARALTGNFILYDVDPIEHQMLIIDELVAQDVDVIAIHANHSEALGAVLAAARAVGIRVCAFAQPVGEESCDRYEKTGEEAAKAAVELLGR